ncbi:MAG: MogA/MoaB family molybdenum cofactor biosynthesis protein [Thermodesulfobacteriota bacterium]
MGIVTVSSSRTADTDKSGQWIKRLAEKEGHRVVDYRIVTDDRHEIARAVTAIIEAAGPHVMIVNGGTGITEKDVTIEAVTPLFGKTLTAFGPLFSQLSFAQIDSAAILSRATAGIIGSTAVFCLPGSLKACKLACKELIFTEIRHIAAHLAS